MIVMPSTQLELKNMEHEEILHLEKFNVWY